MSRFRQSPRDPVTGATPGMVARQPARNLVPMTAEEFSRLRRRTILKWTVPGAAAAVLLGFVLYRFTLPVEAQDSYIDAQKLYDVGKYNDALVMVARATRDRGQRVRALKLRASVYQALHRPEDALADIGKVIELEPKTPSNYRDRALMFLDAGHPEKALEDYTKLIGMENGGGDYNGRGICYMKLNQPQRAIEDFTKAIERAPSVESHLQRGAAYASVGEHRKAVEDFDAAIEIAPSASPVYRARATSLARLGDLKAAERDRARALSLEKPQARVIEQVSVPKR